MLENLNLFFSDWSNNTGAIDLKKESSVKLLGLTVSSKLDWGSYIISIAKITFKKSGVFIHSMTFLSLEVCKSTIWPCMEYCFHVWVGAPSCCLGMLDKLQRRIYRIVGLLLAASAEPLAHHWNVASLRLFYLYYLGRCSSELAELVPLPYSCGSFTRDYDRLHNFCHHS